MPQIHAPAHRAQANDHGASAIKPSCVSAALKLICLSTGNVAASGFWTELRVLPFNDARPAGAADNLVRSICERAYWPRPMLQAIEQSTYQRLILAFSGTT
jgi:hypothetical protein